MLTFDAVGTLLDQIAEEFPPEFYDELNGGILLLPQAKSDPDAPPGELYIMGEYCTDQMGRYINIYYGSFAEVYSHCTDEELADELYATLSHEFTHHIEGLAGERGLEIKDEEFMRDFFAEHGD
ncbi:MAG: metallopeptidase family protein [Pseudoflavonifractor sp.]